MAYNIILFHYIPGHSLLHTTHPGIKLICILLLCVVIFIVEFPALFLLLAIEIICIFLASLRIKRLFSEFKGFLFFIIIIFIFRMYSSDIHCYVANVIPVPSIAGLTGGGLVVARLLMVIVFGVLLTSTTKINDLHNALFSFFYTIPFFPAARLAILVSLTIQSIPLLLDALQEVDEARKSRCIQGNKNPLFHITSFALPLLVHIIEQTDAIADAMSARCYAENRRPEPIPLKMKDLIVLFFSLSTVVLALVLHFSSSIVSFLTNPYTM